MSVVIKFWKTRKSTRRMRVPLIVGWLLVGIGIGIIGGYVAATTHKSTKPNIVTVVEKPTKTDKTLGVNSVSYVGDKILPVPYFRQEYRQSCEAASLRMALKYKGVDVTDMQLLKLFGYNPKHRDMANNIWDDPEQMFVGDVTGGQAEGEGYGVYSTAVAKIGPKIGHELQSVKGVTAQVVARAIYEGNPVIAWGYWNAESKADSWKTADGKTVQAVLKAHVRLVYGVQGSLDNPTAFLVHDPFTEDRTRTPWSTVKLMDQFKKFGSATDQIVIVK